MTWVFDPLLTAEVESAVVNYTLECEGGEYSLSGQNMTMAGERGGGGLNKISLSISISLT